MSPGQSVQQQNAAAKAEMRLLAMLFNSRPSAYAWLVSVLEAHGHGIKSGVLVSLHEIPEQEGSLFSGMWLTMAHEFWEFSVMVSRSDGALLEVEQFENVTPTVPLNAHVRGTGQSFGHLAHQVLNEIHGG